MSEQAKIQAQTDVKATLCGVIREVFEQASPANRGTAGHAPDDGPFAVLSLARRVEQRVRRALPQRAHEEASACTLIRSAARRL